MGAVIGRRMCMAGSFWLLLCLFFTGSASDRSVPALASNAHASSAITDKANPISQMTLSVRFENGLILWPGHFELAKGGRWRFGGHLSPPPDSSIVVLEVQLWRRGRKRSIETQVMRLDAAGTPFKTIDVSGRFRSLTNPGVYYITLRLRDRDGGIVRAAPFFRNRVPVAVLRIEESSSDMRMAIRVFSLFGAGKANNPHAALPSLAFGGDVNLGRRQNWVTGQNGSEAALGQLPEFSKADLSVVNLESVVATAGKLGVDKGEGGPYYYRGRPELLNIFHHAGIDLVGLANNHSGDYGAEAQTEMLGLLDRMNIAHAGAGKNRDQACAPRYAMAGDVVIAFLSVDATMPFFSADTEKPGTCYLNPSEPVAWQAHFEPRVAVARQKAHLIFALVHWGKNFKSRPTSATRDLASDIISAGVDAILGTNSHILQGVELMDGKPILYDAGDLLFDELKPRNRPSGYFLLSLDKGGIRRISMKPVSTSFGFTTLAKGNDLSRTLIQFHNRSAELGTQVTLAAKTAYIELPPGKNREPATPVTADPGQPTNMLRPLTTPPDRCVIQGVPGEVAINPISFGPLELLGLRYLPQTFSKRRLLFVESFWRLKEAPIKDDLWLYQRLIRTSAGKGHRWYGDHEPCDWTWPTSRWTMGVIYRDYHAVRPPYPLEPGVYDMHMGILDRSRDRSEHTRVGQIHVQ